MAFGERVRELRQARGLSQRDLAERVGIDFDYLSKIENGRIEPPSEEVIRRVAGALGADADELLVLADKFPAGSAGTAQNAGAASDGAVSDPRSGDPEPPPKHLPEPALLLSNGVGQEPSARQLGVPVYYNWWVDGGRKAYEMEPPISWPEPLKANATDEVVIDLGTEVMPQIVEIRFYERVGPSGVPPGDPTELLTCESAWGDNRGGPCAMTRRRDPRDGHRQLVLPARSWHGKRHLAVWAAWPALRETFAEPSGPPVVYTAAWLFSLEVDQ